MRAPASRFKRVLDLAIRQFTDIAGDEPRAEIAVGLQLVSGPADNGGMLGQIDGIGNDGGGGIGLRRGSRHHGHGIGDAERKAAAMATAGRDAASGIVGMDHHRAQQAMAIRPIHQADRELLAIAKMQRNVAAIIDVSARQSRRAQHRAKDLLGHRACDCGHRRNEAITCKGCHRRMHAARDDTLECASPRIGRPSQFAELFAELIEQPGEPPRRGLIGRAHICLRPLRLHDQINRAVLQMQPPAVSQKRDLRTPFHARRPGM